MAKVVKGIGKVVGSVFKAVGNFAGMLFKTPKAAKSTANQSTETRLNLTLVPDENKKIVFGETACGTDIRFWETYGAKNERHVQVVAAAGHPIQSFGNMYAEEFPVPFNGSGEATGKYAGQLKRYTQTKGQSGLGRSLGSGTRWTPAASMTGCAYFVLDWLVNQEAMPNGIPSRITQVVKGAKVFDPRRWTIYGGTHNPLDPDTWEYTPLDPNGQPIGRNNALQMLTYVLGLKVKHAQLNKWVLVGGRGVELADIDFDSFIVAANNCETERWYSDCILSTGDSHSKNEAILEAASGGELVDVGGRFSYFVATDDTADISAFLTESDIVGSISWVPQNPISEQFNEVPGSFVDPAALFQTRPLPLCVDQAYYDIDGYEKRGSELKLSSVQDPVQGQKLQRLQLNRSRFQGLFIAPFNLKGLRVRPWSLVRLTFEPFAWNNKLFRVRQQGIGVDGGIQLVLQEDDASIYKPGTVTAVPPPSAGYGGDPSFVFPPDVDVWVIEPGRLPGGGGEEDKPTPVIVIKLGNVEITAHVDDPSVTEVVVRYNRPGGAFGYQEFSATLGRFELLGLASGTDYEIAVAYRVRGILSDFVPLGMVKTGGLTADDTLFFGGKTNAEWQSLLDGLEQAVEELDTVVENANGAFDAQLSELDSGLNGLQNIVSQQTTEINGKATKVSLQAQINRIDGQALTIGAMQTAINDLPNQYASVSSYNTLRNEVTSGRGPYASLALRFSAQQSLIVDGLAGKVNGSDFTSLSGTVSGLQGTVTAHTGRLNAVEILANSRASASSVENLGVAVSAKARVFIQGTTPTEAQTNDLWIHTGDGRKLYAFRNGQWAFADDTNVSGFMSATLSRLDSTDIEIGKKASAATVETIRVKVEGQDADIQSAKSLSIDASGKVNAMVSVRINANGIWTGTETYNNGVTTGIRMQSDLVEFVPSTVGSSFEFKNGLMGVKASNGQRVFELIW